MEQFWTIFWSFIGAVTTGLASWLVVVITNFFNQKIKDKKAAALLSAITQIIVDAVMGIFQEFVEALKKEGKFDAAAQKLAKEKCLARVAAQLTEEMRTYIETNYGDIEVWISQKIEATIYSLKR